MLRHLLTTPALALTLCASTPADAADYLLRKLVQSGETAPGTAQLFDAIPWPEIAINAAGHVAVRAGLAAGTPLDSGVWVDLGSGFELRMRNGDPAPGTGGGLYEAIPGDPMLDGAGNVAVSCDVTGGTTIRGLFRDADGSDSALLLEDQPAPPGVDGTLRGVADLAQMNPAGAIVFRAAIDPNQGEGVFVREANGTLRTIAAGGSLYYPQIDAAGRVAYTATLTSSPNWTYGLFAETPSGLVQLAVTGDVAPGTFVTSHPLQSIAYNADGTVLFWSQFDGLVGAFLADESGITAVPIPLDALAPIMGGGPIGTNVLYAQRDGSLLLHAFHGGAIDNGLYARDAGTASLRTVALAGDVAPGSGGAHFYGFYDVERRDGGDIAFVGLLDDGNWGVYVASPAPQVPALPAAWGAMAAFALLCASRVGWRRASRAS